MRFLAPLQPVAQGVSNNHERPTHIHITVSHLSVIHTRRVQKKPKIAHNTLRQTIDNGGLKLPDLKIRLEVNLGQTLDNGIRHEHREDSRLATSNAKSEAVPTLQEPQDPLA